MKKYFILFLKIVISLGILYFLFTRVDIEQLWELIQKSKWYILIVAIIFYGLGQVLSTYKWSILIHSHGERHSFKNLVSYYYVGMFFNLFMPSIVGGDIQRCYAVYREERKSSPYSPPKGRLTEIVSSVMMERITGLMALIWLSSISYFFFFKGMNIPREGGDNFIQSGLPLILGVLFMGSIGFLIIPLFIPFERFHRKNSEGLISKIYKHILNLMEHFKDYIKSPKLFFPVIGISLIFQTLIILLNVLLGYALHLEVPLLYYFIAVPLITLCSAIPISLSGFGVREGAYAYFLHYMNIDITQALLLSFSFMIVVGINALIGGLILLKKGFVIEKEMHEDE